MKELDKKCMYDKIYTLFYIHTRELIGSIKNPRHLDTPISRYLVSSQSEFPEKAINFSHLHKNKTCRF